jgi:arylsulfatase A-like enzyme
MDSLREKVGTVPSQVSKYDRALRAVRTDRWKLIEGSDGETALYDLDSDPTETRDVSRDNPETTRRLRDALADRFGVLRMASEEGDRIDDRTAERLEDLGYLQ